MRLIGRKAVREKVSLSFAQIARLEVEGKFPKRLRLTEHPRGRVAWLESEIDDWIAERIKKRS